MAYFHERSLSTIRGTHNIKIWRRTNMQEIISRKHDNCNKLQGNKRRNVILTVQLKYIASTSASTSASQLSFPKRHQAQQRGKMIPGLHSTYIFELYIAVRIISNIWHSRPLLSGSFPWRFLHTWNTYFITNKLEYAAWEELSFIVHSDNHAKNIEESWTVKA